MLSFTAPWWFLGLLILPLVWWVHRFRERGQIFQVAALFLWSGDRQTGSTGSLAARPHPLWWLRGLLVCLLVLALCGPHWGAGRARPLTVWVDDSLSMYSRNAQGVSRMQRALAELQVHLAAASYTPITLRSLGVPGRTLALDAADSADIDRRLQAWSRAPGGEPLPPLAVNMRAGSEHWLLGDGASDLAAWVQNAPLSRLVLAGSETENVAISSLVVSAAGAGVRVLVSVRNGGEQAVQRSLDVRAGDALLATLQLSLAPAGEVQRVLALRRDQIAGSAPLRVVLSPGDALPLDDELQIAAVDLQAPRVQVSAACGPHLRAALAANPVLAVGGYGQGGRDLLVDCDGGAAPQQGPVILARAGAGSAPLTGGTYWHAAGGPLRGLALAPSALRRSAGSLPAPGTLDLLTVGEESLISLDVGRGVVDVRLDLAAPALVRSPEYPLLVSGLVDLALGRETSAGVIAAARNAAPARIAPRTLVVAQGQASAAVQQFGKDLSGYLIGIVLGLLCLDALVLLIRHVGQSRMLKQWQPRHAP